MFRTVSSGSVSLCHPRDSHIRGIGTSSDPDELADDVTERLRCPLPADRTSGRVWRHHDPLSAVVTDGDGCLTAAARVPEDPPLHWPGGLLVRHAAYVVPIL